jgi:hypothetical protein
VTQPEAMLLSIAIEAPIVLALGRASSRDEPTVRLLMVAIGATLVTHPFAWYGVPALGPALGAWPAFGVVELAVAVVESVFYAQIAGLGWRWGLAAGFVSNSVSAGYGVLIWLGVAPG